MPPPLGYPQNAIVMYYRIREQKFSINLSIHIAMRPVPQRGTGGARGGELYQTKFLLSSNF